MDVKQRAFSSSNLSTPFYGILSPPWGSSPPVRARSTVNLSGPPCNSRNRALSWSPIRFESPSKVSCLPWARREGPDAPLKKTSSIDGSVLKAKEVWEQKTTTNSCSRELLATEKELPKKPSVSFRHQKTAVVAPMLQRSSTGESIFQTSNCPNLTNAKLREKKHPPSGTALNVISQRRLGFIGAESDELDVMSETEAIEEEAAKSIFNDSIQSGGGRPTRRGGQGAMDDGSHPFVKSSPFSSSSPSPVCAQPGIKHQQSSPQLLQSTSEHQQHSNNFRATSNHLARSNTVQPNPSQSQLIGQVFPGQRSQYQAISCANDPFSLQKAKSLPGHYARSTQHLSPQTSFRDAFAISRSPTPTRKNDSIVSNSPHSSKSTLHSQNGFNPASFYTNQHTPGEDSQQNPLSHNRQNVSSRRLPLEQPFNPNSSPVAHSTSSHKQTRPQQPLPSSALLTQNQQKHVRHSTPDQYQSKADSDLANDKKSKRSLLGLFKKRRKNDPKDSLSSDDDQKPKPRVKPSNPSVASPASATNTRTNYGFTVLQDGRTVVRVAPEKVLASNNCASAGQPLGIPVMIPASGGLHKRAVSASHDSVMPVRTNQSSALLPDCSYSLSKRSSSIDNVARKERRQALKVRAENLRTKHKDSSSEEDEKSLSSQSMYGSAHSLNRTGSLTKRSKAARTERYLRRKSHELETLRLETEKDKKNKAAVQARILEIQKLQQLEAERNKKALEKEEDELPKPSKPRWSANLVYQESNEFDSVVLQTPPATPDSHRRSTVDIGRPDPVRQNLAQIRHANSVHARNSSYSPSANNGLGVTVGEYSSNSSLNRRLPSDGLSMGDLKNHRSVSYDCNINKPYTPPSSDHGKSRATPPPPPPRDRNRIVSPAEHRPFSYSFENLNRESPSGSQSQLNNKCTTASQGIRAILSQTRQFPAQPYAPKVAFTETQISSPKSSSHSVSLPPLPSSAHALSPQASSTSHQAFSFSAHHKVEAPSPQSDVNENEHIDHLNDVWKQKSQQRESSRSCAAAYMVNGNVVSDSSRSSTPKDGTGPQALYNDAVMSKSRAKANTIKAESTSSLSSRSDIASPVTKPIPAKRTEFLNRETRRQDTGSTTTQKDESLGETRPNIASLERAKREMQLILQKERSLLQTKAEKQKQFEEAYLREKRKLEKNRCTNFEEALHELEELYRSLKLDVEEGPVDEKDAVNVDTPNTSPRERGRSRTPSVGRQKTLASAETDDMHYRRCLQSAKTTTDSKKVLQITPSYLLISQAYLSASDPELNQPSVGVRPKDEPDIVHDDASLRNIKRANAVKVIDPQPPFGIPIGPTTQASPNNYLHLQHKNLSKSKSLPRHEPDPAGDDLAFRNLRRDQREKPVNTLELDEILSESNESPHISRRSSRSQSADRVRGFQRNYSDQYTAIPNTLHRSQTPRKVKHGNEGKKNGKFKDGQEVENGSKTSFMRSNRNAPSWLDRAHLNDPEINGDLSSTKAVSQPDIRSAIIREARAPTGGPDEFSFEQLALTHETPFSTTTHVPHGASTGDLTAPKLVKIQTLSHASINEGLIAKKLFRPPETAFNNKPKPFYLADAKPGDKRAVSTAASNVETTVSSPPVNIAQLESLISTISTAENEIKNTLTQPKPVSSYCRVYAPTSKIRSTSVESPYSTLLSPTQNGPPKSIENEKSPSNAAADHDEHLSKENNYELDNHAPQSAFQKYEVKSAKHNIMNAIRLSMAMGSASSEGNCMPPVTVDKSQTSDVLPSVSLSSELSQKMIFPHASSSCSLHAAAAAASSLLDASPSSLTCSSKAKASSKQPLSSAIVSRIFSSENSNYTRSMSLIDTGTRFDFQTSGNRLDDACTNNNWKSLSNDGSHASLEFCSLETPSLPVQAATYTNKVNSMVVTSESVLKRARRAHSLPSIAPDVQFSFQRKFDNDRAKLPADSSVKLIDDKVIDQYLSSREFLFSDKSIFNSVGRPAEGGDDNAKVSVHKASPKPPSRSSSIPPQGLASNRNSWASQSASLDKSEECSKISQDLLKAKNEVSSQALMGKDNTTQTRREISRNSDVNHHELKLASSETKKDYHEIESTPDLKVHESTVNSSNRNSQDTSQLTSSDHIEFVDSCDVQYLKSDGETDASHSEYESLENPDDGPGNIQTSSKSCDNSNLTITNASKIVLDVAVELSNQIYQGEWNKTNKIDERIDVHHETLAEPARNEITRVEESNNIFRGSNNKLEKTNKKLAFGDIDCSFFKDLHLATQETQKVKFVDSTENRNEPDEKNSEKTQVEDVAENTVEQKILLQNISAGKSQLPRAKMHDKQEDTRERASDDMSSESLSAVEDATLIKLEGEATEETLSSNSSKELDTRRPSMSNMNPEPFHVKHEESDSIEFADAEDKMDEEMDSLQSTDTKADQSSEVHESQSLTLEHEDNDGKTNLQPPRATRKTHSVKSDVNDIFDPDRDEVYAAKPLNHHEVELDSVSSRPENERSEDERAASPVDAVNDIAQSVQVKNR
ncbi:hypothetical protein FHG87_018847 [Trinorchestia longiramus]|nr:hypothetical protein FHG87_018847 [Trinorchestia longiramus]